MLRSLVRGGLFVVGLLGLVPSASAEPAPSPQVRRDVCSPGEVRRAMTSAGSSAKDPAARTEAVRAAFRERLESCVLGRLEWVKTSPVDDPTTWRLARHDATEYVHTLFAGGVLSGTTPSEAYRVVCDSTTMVGEPLARDQLRIIVAAAVVRPSELEQLALTIQSSAR